MQFLIADTFTDSLGRLRGDEQRAVKTTAFDLQVDPNRPGMSFHRLDKAKDRSFFSVRVNDDLRLIVHRTDVSLLLCYVAHHDAAYAWAERRVLERHPTTGAAQIVEIRELIRDIEVPRYIDVDTPRPPAPPRSRLFAATLDEDLLAYGVPLEWLADVRAATDDTLFELAEHLPAEATEALLQLATGSTPRVPVHTDEQADPFAHPDAQRRFRVVENADALERALDYPWEKWAVFLHPTQQELVDRQYRGPARVSGSAGTGKTVVALHRAVHLARTHPQARVLLTTFGDTLARVLRQKLGRLVGNEPEVHDRITVRAINRVGIDVYEAAFGPAHVADASTVRELIHAASAAGVPHRFTDRFLEAEWRDVVDAWQLDSWELYRDVARLGRKTRLAENQRALLWTIFEQARAGLAAQQRVTIPGVFRAATEHLDATADRPYDFAVIDEAQDIGVPQLRFLAALAGDRSDGLFFAGDLGQRIFQTPFSWRALGVDVRGRSQTLRINYRTSHQIRRQADRLLPAELADVDENTEVRRGTVSAFNGPEPMIEVLDSEANETAAIATWLRARRADGIVPDEMGVFVRSDAELPRAIAAVEAAGLTPFILDGASDGGEGCVAVSTMHHAKGLEYRAVVVAACDDEVIPLQSRIEDVADDADLEDIYNTERQLLYVACTRARDHLLVTGVAPASEFLDDLGARATVPTSSVQ